MKKTILRLVLIIFIALLLFILKSFDIYNYASYIKLVIIYFGFVILLYIVSYIILVKCTANLKDENDIRKSIKVLNILEKITIITESILPDLRMNKSFLFACLGDYNSALNSLSFKLNEKANRLVSLTYYIYLASCHIHLGNLSEAESSITKADFLFKKIDSIKHNEWLNEYNISILKIKIELKAKKGENDNQLNELLEKALQLQSKYPSKRKFIHFY